MKLQIEEFSHFRKNGKPWVLLNAEKRFLFGAKAYTFMNLHPGKQFHLAYKDQTVYLLNPINDKNLLTVTKNLCGCKGGINCSRLVERLDILYDAEYVVEDYKDEDHTGYQLKLLRLK